MWDYMWDDIKGLLRDAVTIGTVTAIVSCAVGLVGVGFYFVVKFFAN